ncbi:hypothetical protein BC940DRAFT_36637 [Gongronella butleri]|nr:hypothetical protein BC940DRAFT_36637 [Gongronella butleri]
MPNDACVVLKEAIRKIYKDQWPGFQQDSTDLVREMSAWHAIGQYGPHAPKELPLTIVGSDITTQFQSYFFQLSKWSTTKIRTRKSNQNGQQLLENPVTVDNDHKTACKSFFEATKMICARPSRISKARTRAICAKACSDRCRARTAMSCISLASSKCMPRATATILPRTSLSCPMCCRRCSQSFCRDSACCLLQSAIPISTACTA